MLERVHRLPTSNRHIFEETLELPTLNSILKCDNSGDYLQNSQWQQVILPFDPGYTPEADHFLGQERMRDRMRGAG